MTTPRQRAILGCQLLAAGYRPGFDGLAAMGCELLGWCAEDDALLVRYQRRVILLGLGSGYGHASRWRLFEILADWVGNGLAQLPRWVADPVVPAPVRTPMVGKSGNWWAWGFLTSANRVDAWLNATYPGLVIELAFCHSRAAAWGQILAWSRSSILEAHCIASPRVAFSAVPDCPRVHVWNKVDDAVGKVPLGAGHIGQVHELDALGDTAGERHRVPAYATVLQAAESLEIAAAAREHHARQLLYRSESHS